MSRRADYAAAPGEAPAVTAWPDASPAAAPPATTSRLVAGVGCSRGCPTEELLALIDATLPPGELVALATVDRRADEPCMVAAAAHYGVPLLVHGAERLAAVAVPTPSAVVARHVGTASVAEAAALLSGGDLLVPKTRSRHATCAVAACPE